MPYARDDAAISMKLTQKSLTARLRRRLCRRAAPNGLRLTYLPFRNMDVFINRHFPDIQRLLNKSSFCQSASSPRADGYPPQQTPSALPAIMRKTDMIYRHSPSVFRDDLLSCRYGFLCDQSAASASPSLGAGGQRSVLYRRRDCVSCRLFRVLSDTAILAFFSGR